MRTGPFLLAMFPYLTSLLLATSSVVGQQSAIEDERLPSAAEQTVADATISEGALRADIKFLADDLLEGRGPGTRGDDLRSALYCDPISNAGPPTGCAEWRLFSKSPVGRRDHQATKKSDL